MNLSFATRLFAIALLAFFLQGSVKSCGLVYLGELSSEQTLDVDGSATLSVQSSGGSVQIDRGPEGKISVTMKFSVRAGDRAGARQLLKQLEQDPPLEREGNKIRLGDLSKYKLPTGGFFDPSISIDFQLKVPAGTSLDIQTNSGDLNVSRLSGTLKAELGWGAATVKSFEGALDIKTTTGRLTLANLRGQTKLESKSGLIFLNDIRGDLTVESKSGSVELDSEITLGAQWHFQTQSGNVTLALPQDSQFQIRARSTSGQIKIDFPLTTTGLRDEWQVTAQVGGSKPDARIEMITQSGNVQIGRK